jgi:hypothetical protein
MFDLDIDTAVYSLAVLELAALAWGLALMRVSSSARRSEALDRSRLRADRGR